MPALVRLRRVHQKRVAQVHGAGFARGRDHTPASGRGKAIGSELPERQPLLSCGRELPGDVRVRPDPDACRRIALTHVGKPARARARALGARCLP